MFDVEKFQCQLTEVNDALSARKERAEWVPQFEAIARVALEVRDVRLRVYGTILRAGARKEWEAGTPAQNFVDDVFVQSQKRVTNANRRSSVADDQDLIAYDHLYAQKAFPEESQELCEMRALDHARAYVGSGVEELGRRIAQRIIASLSDDEAEVREVWEDVLQNAGYQDMLDIAYRLSLLWHDYPEKALPLVDEALEAFPDEFLKQNAAGLIRRKCMLLATWGLGACANDWPTDERDEHCQEMYDRCKECLEQLEEMPLWERERVISMCAIIEMLAAWRPFEAKALLDIVLERTRALGMEDHHRWLLEMRPKI
jgi:hypothetical protein